MLTRKPKDWNLEVMTAGVCNNIPTRTKALARVAQNFDEMGFKRTKDKILVLSSELESARSLVELEAPTGGVLVAFYEDCAESKAFRLWTMSYFIFFEMLRLRSTFFPSCTSTR